MDLSKLSWIKNVRHDDSNLWAYSLSSMPVPEARIFRLNWRTPESRGNAEKPRKGELMLLLQRAKVSHVVEFIDDEVYENGSGEWSIHRVVKALWMPPENCNWDQLPHQKKIFGFDHVVGDGAAHHLADDDRMPRFHDYWNKKGGLEAFQKHLGKLLEEISSS